MPARLLFDAHLDLAMNALEWNRDLTQPVVFIREVEKDMEDKPDRGHATVSLSEMRKANIGICVATLIAKYVPQGHYYLKGWRSQEQAWAQTQGQWAWYKAMEATRRMKAITNWQDLQQHLESWENDPENTPIGYILSLEGADSIYRLEELELSWERGLRAIGPAHYGPCVYAFGTDSDGPLPEKGKDLLREMDRIGYILDASHLSDQCFWEALEIYQGPVWASHNNCRSLVPHNRQFSDDMIRALLERGSVIGAVLDAWMIIPGWERRVTTPESADLHLDQWVDHIDHICQIAGHAGQVAIGSDLDGGFGNNQTPLEIQTIADLQKVPDLLQKRGFSAADIDGIFHGNWLRFLKKHWK